MSLKNALRQLRGKKAAPQPRGDSTLALGGLLAGRTRPVLFDIGAHFGETHAVFARQFEDAEIFCFEPFPDSYARLAENTAARKDSRAFNIGFSDQPGRKDFNANRSSPTNSLLELDKRAPETWNMPGLLGDHKVSCEFDTVDNFIQAHGLSRIDLLKMDVQGAEYQVLTGAETALKNGMIDTIYMEIITGPTYVGQWPTDRYMAYLRERGFELFGLYNLDYRADQYLKQMDAIFTRSR